MFCEPARSPYDWHFELFRYPVRVTWLFWVVSAFWGFGWAQMWDEFYAFHGMDSPGVLPILLIWVGVCFLSILIHELGHSLAMTWYGESSYIVLYHFGGLAISNGYGSWKRGGRRPIDQIVISAAGPGLQLTFGLAVAAIAMLSGLHIGTTAGFVQGWLPLPHGTVSTSAFATAFIDSAVYTSVFWAILNLVPVLPMDGGRIAESLFRMYGAMQASRDAIVLSIIVAALIALWAFRIEHTPLGMNFMILGVMNYQSLNDPFSLR
jgi:stage IV sporulation protein FB